jgi:maleylacetoacetate isomerase
MALTVVGRQSAGFMRLYTYFRSSAAYRVRIALAIKGIKFTASPIHMIKDGGQHRAPEYLQINPMGLVPALEMPDGVISQSLAICEYLEELHPAPPLLPHAALDRAYVRAVANAVACEIHPLNNLRVLTYLTGTMGLSESAKLTWYRHWIAVGLSGIEQLIARSGRSGDFCLGDTPGLGDVFLVPQIYNARRFGCPLTDYPQIAAIVERAERHPAFIAARPESQDDWEG